MFELSVAIKYLLPKKRSLSTALISFLSIFVISLVVWLVLVFLSVTTGIEKKWTEKLTSLNAPLRITPTETYYSSYYYQIDGLAKASDYSLKNIKEKQQSKVSDPYVENEDMELPSFWPKPDLRQGALVDPVKKAFSILEKQAPKYHFSYQDYEISSALLKLHIQREKTTYLSQVAFLLSFPENNPNLFSLILPPTSTDLTHLVNKVSSSKKERSAFFSNLDIHKVRWKEFYSPNLSLFPEGNHFSATAELLQDKILSLSLEENAPKNLNASSNSTKSSEKVFGKFFVNKTTPYFQYLDHQNHEKTLKLAKNIPIQVKQPLIFSVSQCDFSQAKSLEDVELQVTGKLQNIPLQGKVPFLATDLLSFSQKNPPKKLPLWPFQWNNKAFLPKQEKQIGIILPKIYRDSGVLIGDGGFLSYTAQTPTSMQEQKIAIYVSGFYDPGIMPVGNRFLLVPSSVTQTINSSLMTFSPDGTPMNGIYVWFNDFSQAEKIKSVLEKSFKEAGVDNYWKVSTFKEYEFSKDLLQQFQSDKTLFTLIACIILLVACSNIISLLVVLVHDKKKEIAILQAMGASSKSIAMIFGSCGIIMGFFSSCFGVLAALFTLKHLNVLVRFLSFIQGHEAFNPAFFGNSLPNELSIDALIFVLVATPIISLLAGLIPALKASKLKPSSILRAE